MRNEKGQFKKGIIPWNAGSTNGTCYSDLTRLKMSLAKKGKPSPKKGVPISEEQKKKMVATRRKNGSYLRGIESPWWKGGTGYASEDDRVRKSPEYKDWRVSVFARDGFTCQWCGIRGGELNADHIKPFSRFPDLRFSLGNGRTLCVDCHKLTDTYGRKWQDTFWHASIYEVYKKIAYA